MTYKVHKLRVNMTSRGKDIFLTEKFEYLEDFLNGLEGEVVAIIPNVDSSLFGMSLGIDYLFVIEKLQEK